MCPSRVEKEKEYGKHGAMTRGLNGSYHFVEGAYGHETNEREQPLGIPWVMRCLFSPSWVTLR
jgi:hypothetical protein